MSSLKSAFTELTKAVGLYLQSSGAEPSEVFAAVFAVNNEIGRLMRASGDSRLKELQHKVNEVTRAAKIGDRRRLREAMQAAESAARRLDARDD